ncbi:MAG: hypothetical protein AB1349_10615 [Elusimicrobiota bacterium]
MSTQQNYERLERLRKIFPVLLFAICYLLFATSLIAKPKTAHRKPITDKTGEAMKIHYDQYIQQLVAISSVNYTHSQVKAIDRALEKIVNLQNETYISMKTLDVRRTYYTTLTIERAFDAVNEVGIQTINLELDRLHRLTDEWKELPDDDYHKWGQGQSLIKGRIYSQIRSCLNNLWQIYYAWDNWTAELTRDNYLYTEYAVLSKRMEEILATHKLFLRILYQKGLTDESIFCQEYEPLEWKTTAERHKPKPKPKKVLPKKK